MPGGLREPADAVQVRQTRPGDRPRDCLLQGRQAHPQGALVHRPGRDPGKPAVTLRVGLELNPQAALPAEGAFEATRDSQDGSSHYIRLRGMGEGLFHVVVKDGAKGGGKARAARRPRKG